MYEPQDRIKTIRTNFGSRSGHLEYLRIIFWNLTLLTGDSPGLFFWANSTKNGSFYLHADTYQAQNLIQTIRTTFEIRGESASVVLD